MKRTVLYVLLTTIMTGLVCAGTENVPNPTTITLPQPSTLLICAAGLFFFRYVEKRVP